MLPKARPIRGDRGFESSRLQRRVNTNSISAEDTQYPFVAADSIQAAALPCWLILWSSARPLVNAAGPGCKISDDLISYTSWCCVAGFRLKPGRAALVQAGISCRTRPNDQIRCLFD